jgi:oxygen-dependent protoporphyrinogen oxidase
MKYMIAKRRRMKRENIKSRKGLYSFNGGLGAITAELARRLGDSFVTGAAVDGVIKRHHSYTVTVANQGWDARSVVSAVPPASAAKILGTLAPGVIKPLEQTPMAPVSLVHWSQPQANGELPAGFGFLMPRIFKLRILGTIFASQLFRNRTPDGQALFTSYYGGMLDGKAMSLSDGELLKLLLAEHREIFGIDLVEPPMVKIIRYPDAIPQLTPSHPERIAKAREALATTPGVFLAGNYLTGVGVEHAAQSGYMAADETAEFLAGGYGNAGGRA